MTTVTDKRDVMPDRSRFSSLRTPAREYVFSRIMDFTFCDLECASAQGGSCSYVLRSECELRAVARDRMVRPVGSFDSNEFSIALKREESVFH